MALEELKAQMRYQNITHGAMSKQLGITLSTFSRKINNQYGAEFTPSQMCTIGERMGLAPEEMLEYFFEDYLQNARKRA